MDYNEIKNLINDIGQSNVDEVNLEFPDGIKISVKKNNQVVKEIMKENASEMIENLKEPIAVKNEQESTQDCKVIKSPMVGTFYSKSAPTASPFVKVGDKVKKGQVLCILEAMKLMNEIESEYDGEIAEICVKDDEMVEFGQILFKIK